MTELSNYKLNTRHFVKFTATKEVQEKTGAYCPVPRFISSGAKYKKICLGTFPPQAKAGVCMGMMLSCFCLVNIVMVCTVVFILSTGTYFSTIPVFIYRGYIVLHRSKNIINFSNLRLILQVQWRIEIGYLLIGAFTD